MFGNEREGPTEARTDISAEVHVAVCNYYRYVLNNLVHVLLSLSNLNMATLRHSLNGCIAFFTAALPLSVPVTKRFEAFDLQMLQENLPRTPCCCFHAQDASRDWLQPPCSLGRRTSDHDAPTPKVNRSPCTEFSKRREITWAALITLILTTVSHLPAISSRMELTHCQAVSEREAAHADCTIGLSSACKKSPWDSASICMETRRRGCLFLPTVLPNRVPVVVVCPSPSISLPETHPSPSPSLSNKSGHESLLSPTRMTSSDPGKEWDVVLVRKRHKQPCFCERINAHAGVVHTTSVEAHFSAHTDIA